jgi:hypothetical protein
VIRLESRCPSQAESSLSRLSVLTYHSLVIREGEMAMDEKWQRARLFPVAGIGNRNEQERRGCSVLLAVLSSVKEFGRAMTGRCGAPAGLIETFIEVPFELNGSHCRPDGLIRVTRGQRT